MLVRTIALSMLFVLGLCMVCSAHCPDVERNWIVAHKTEDCTEDECYVTLTYSCPWEQASLHTSWNCDGWGTHTYDPEYGWLEDCCETEAIHLAKIGAQNVWQGQQMPSLQQMLINPEVPDVVTGSKMRFQASTSLCGGSGYNCCDPIESQYAGDQAETGLGIYALTCDGDGVCSGSEGAPPCPRK